MPQIGKYATTIVTDKTNYRLKGFSRGAIVTAISLLQQMGWIRFNLISVHMVRLRQLHKIRSSPLVVRIKNRSRNHTVWTA